MAAIRSTSYILHPTSYIFLCIAALFVWLFASVLFTDSTLAFRDGAQFYFPLFEHCREEWAAGRVPLWNPYLGLGQPLLADGVSSVFYPGKLLFALPLDYVPLYNAYILLHVLLAAWAAYRLARHWGASLAAAGIAALSYAFSGSVLFNVYNIVFLVGAAWLPLALLAADKMLSRRSLAWAVALGAVLALMVLGGDPQMAYQAGLLAAGLAVARGRCKRAAERRERGEPDSAQIHNPQSTIQNPSVSPLPSPFSPLVLLALAAATAFLLSAVQVLPSYELSRRSTRAAAPLADRFFARTPPESQLEDAYHFSVGPWRLAEFVLPNVAGQQFPIHRRWLNALPAEGRVWSPTLYMGLLPLVLAFFAMRFCRVDTQGGSRTARPTLQTQSAAKLPPTISEGTGLPHVFLSWVVLLAVLASFGWYGIGWALGECGVDTQPFGAPAGGLFWLLNLILPGYAQFRYPAKLLVVAALGLSLLAARGLDGQIATPSRRLQRCLIALAATCGVGLAAGFVLRSSMLVWLSGVPADPLFGPLDAAGAWRDITFALAQAAVVATAGAILLHARLPSFACDSGGGGEGCSHRSLRSSACVLLVALDLAVANGWLITTVPVDILQTPEPSPVAVRVYRDQAASLPAPPRIAGPATYVRWEWQTSSSPERMAQVVARDREVLRPHLNLLDRVGVVDTDGTFVLADFAECCSELDAALGTREVIVNWPRAWLAPARNGVPEAHTATPFAPLRDVPSGRCRIVSYTADEVVVEVDAAGPNTLVLVEQFYPGWQAERVDSDGGHTSLAVLPAYIALRGVDLPAGACRVVFRYRPIGFYVGAAMSITAWIGLIGRALRRAIRLWKARWSNATAS